MASPMEAVMEAMVIPMVATMEAIHMVDMVDTMVAMVAPIMVVVSGTIVAAAESVMFVNIYILCKLHRI